MAEAADALRELELRCFRMRLPVLLGVMDLDGKQGSLVNLRQ